MRRLLPLVLLLGACEVGKGDGDVTGSLEVKRCRTNGDDYPTADDGPTYDLDPSFFAAEPVQDIGRSAQRHNHLFIRLQNTGRQRELTDVLRFIIPSSYQVARCVRGRRAGDGQPDFDQRECSWASGSPRVRVGPDALVRAYLTPRALCPPSRYVPRNVAAAAVSTPGPADGWESWIEFKVFGAAKAEPTDPDDDRTTKEDFRVEFGQRLWASRFELKLDDARIVEARKEGDPIPEWEIRGQLGGYFDFDMERGQGAQTFP